MNEEAKSEGVKEEALRAALFKYGEHDEDCEHWNHWNDKPPVCTCGLADALRL